jgi:hypothetical protein
MKKPTKPTNLGKFDPCDTTDEQLAEWIRAGDIEEAKELAMLLAIFLSQLAENKEVIKAIMMAGIPWIGTARAKIISERLLDNPAFSKEAQKEVSELIKQGHRHGSNQLAKAYEKMRLKPNEMKGKSTKTGAELFAAFLVPNKQSKNHFVERWIASVIPLNPDLTIKQLTEFINGEIKRNNEAKEKSKGWGDYDPSYPKQTITPDRLKKAHAKYKDEIDKARGIHRAE